LTDRLGQKGSQPPPIQVSVRPVGERVQERSARALPGQDDHLGVRAAAEEHREKDEAASHRQLRIEKKNSRREPRGAERLGSGRRLGDDTDSLLRLEQTETGGAAFLLFVRHDDRDLRHGVRKIIVTEVTLQSNCCFRRRLEAGTTKVEVTRKKTGRANPAGGGRSASPPISSKDREDC